MHCFNFLGYNEGNQTTVVPGPSSQVVHDDVLRGKMSCNFCLKYSVKITSTGTDKANVEKCNKKKTEDNNKGFSWKKFDVKDWR